MVSYFNHLVEKIMNKVIYFTLADAYKANESVYDQALKDAVYGAACDVGKKVLIAALCQTDAEIAYKKAA